MNDAKNYYRNLAVIAAGIADAKKANSILVLDVQKLIFLVDYFVICSADNDRQVKAISHEIEREFKLLGIRPISVQGTHESKWELMDFGGFIVHIFREEMRQYYELEELWSDAPKVRWKSHLAKLNWTSTQEPQNDGTEN